MQAWFATHPVRLHHATLLARVPPYHQFLRFNASLTLDCISVSISYSIYLHFSPEKLIWSYYPGWPDNSRKVNPVKFKSASCGILPGSCILCFHLFQHGEIFLRKSCDLNLIKLNHLFSFFLQELATDTF